MYKLKIAPILLMTVFIVSNAFGQEATEAHQIKNISGVVQSTDSVGNKIVIQTKDQQQIAFIVPDKAIITQETNQIGLMEIGKSDAVSIQYYQAASSNTNYVVSIVDNEPVINE